MDLVAGVGEMFSNLAVGLSTTGTNPDTSRIIMSKRSGPPVFESLPDKVLLIIFSYLPHREICKYSLVCKKWKMIAQDSRLWNFVSLRPEISGLHVDRVDNLINIIPTKFGANLKYLELPTELVTPQVLEMLAKKCPNITHLLIDFAQANQLHDFTDLNGFPTSLKFMCIYLSDVIFLDNFMKKIYSFINGLEMLHIVGTYEKGEEIEGEIYEVLNFKTLKQATPNLRIINLYGVSFLDDSHIEAFSSNCIQLQVLNVNFCSRVEGQSLKILVHRCRNLTCLMLQQTNLKGEYVSQVEWENAVNLQELDVTATDLPKDVLLDVLTRIPSLRWLSAGQLDGFTDSVLKQWMENGNLKSLVALDLDSSDNLTEDSLHKFVSEYGAQLEGLSLSGMVHITDSLWASILPMLRNARILVLGTSEKMSMKIHVDHLIDSIAKYCPQLERLEFRWDNQTLRFSDKNQKAIDMLRSKCLKLKCMALSDGKLYEIMRGNFERADRKSVIRTTTMTRVTLHYLLKYYKELLFS
ncbi:uncharacterized protein FipoQ [Lepeophtheirus salmonis]|uniref:uncharacterized protein FipoQ n=1 Tax=Lepeophtheirus salmonis TaxID=72036 RepID=UPI001AE566DF|nr:F-box/LRR-repeat protein 7-like [Lepeophtheirus salmonis]XP_040570922.1 F-box/LRR-repeat protein 7-like [Lepeophtheirus salmonis]